MTKQYNITIGDYTNYHPNLSRNGGQYAFWEFACFDENGKLVDGEHTTSAEFPYCEACGSFSMGSCCDGVYYPSSEMKRAIQLALKGKSDSEIHDELWPRNKNMEVTVAIVVDDNNNDNSIALTGTLWIRDYVSYNIKDENTGMTLGEAIDRVFGEKEEVAGGDWEIGYARITIEHLDSDDKLP